MARIDLWRPRRASMGRTASSSGFFGELARMQREMDELFDQMVGDTGEMMSRMTGTRTFAPALDVIDCGKEVLVRADLPGLEQKDVAVELEDGTLTVRGERRDEHEEHDDRYHWTERWEGKFARTIALPPGVQADKINAEFKNGVLEIHIPKDERGGSKKIEIRGESTAALGVGARSGQAPNAQGQASQSQSQSSNPTQRK